MGALARPSAPVNRRDAGTISTSSDVTEVRPAALSFPQVLSPDLHPGADTEQNECSCLPDSPLNPWECGSPLKALVLHTVTTFNYRVKHLIESYIVCSIEIDAVWPWQGSFIAQRASSRYAKVVGPIPSQGTYKN